ncbi:MAG: alcohol dehydrogenase [Pedosphaera sp.]|nr:alcohol dehydrogenase [Pedosphaera sp.]
MNKVGGHLVCVFTCVVGMSSAADWPHWRGTSHNGVSMESGWQSGLEKVAWRAKVGIGFSSCAVAGDSVLTMGHDGKSKGGQETVYCFDANTGKLKWSDSYPAALLPNLHEGGPAATPTISGGKVYTLSKDGNLRCYDLRSGKRDWEFDLLKYSGLGSPPEWGFAGSPLILGANLIVEAGRTFALNKADGKEIWRSGEYKPAYGSPVPFEKDGRTRLAVVKTEGLVILDAGTGKTTAFTEWKTSYETSACTPIVLGNQIFISTGYKRGCALFELADGKLKQIYTHRELSNHMNSSVVIEGFIYGFDGNSHMAGAKELVCMELNSGKVRWRQAGLQCGSLMAADGRLILLGETGTLAVAKASAEKYELLASSQVLGGRCWTPPVLANGRIYCRNAAGDLVCIDVRKP